MISNIRIKSKSYFLGVDVCAYPYQTDDFNFVNHWTDEQKLEAAKIINRNLKYWVKTDLIHDLWHDCVLYLLERKEVPVGKSGRHSKDKTYKMRSLMPGDLTTFLNKVVKPKYYSNEGSISFVDNLESASGCDLLENIMLGKSMQKLLADENDFIQYVFFNGGTPAEYSREKNTSKMVVSNKQKRIFKKLREAIGD